MTYWYPPLMVKQARNMGDTFICEHCKNYEGGCACAQHIFIAFTGANMEHCHYYERGVKCPYCGRNI